MTTTQKNSARVFAIGPSEIKEIRDVTVADLRQLLASGQVIWADFDGPVDKDTLAEIGQIFELHPLSLEDVTNARQRPKVEHYPKYHFIVTRMVNLTERLESEQLSIFFGKSFVLTFQEKPGGDCLEPLRDSLRLGSDAIRHTTPDYLAYALVDMVVDGFFPVIKTLGDRLNDLEEEIFRRHDQHHASRIHAIKRDIWALRQTIWPVRDALATLQRDNISLVQSETRLYLRDCYDHAMRIIELVESHQTMCSDLMDLQMSRENSRMNEILRVLTIISTLFIPPTFIAGIYGMNFNPDKSPLNMPELNWYLGYPFALAIMALMMGGLIFWMWWKGWMTGVISGRRIKLPFRKELKDRQDRENRLNGAPRHH
ncbi:MAG: magnesium/cobalt transporter CorA [Candidatus Melainabacteria bacterium]|nr:magnesium/cobalt transporter CorA [Candidatus Melainabacteria bacterium]